MPKSTRGSMEAKARPILSSVVCTPASASVGEAVRIEVIGPDRKPYNNNESTAICINGVPGSTQYMVWDHPGKKTLVATARPNGKSLEMLKATVNVTASAKAHPFIKVDWRLDRPTSAVFSIMNLPEPKAAFARDGERRIRLLKNIPALVTEKRPGREQAEAVGGPMAHSVYSWEFSHGKKVSSTRPMIGEEFAPYLEPDKAYKVFTVKVTIKHPGDEPITLHRSVSMGNPYHLMKRRGVLQPFTLSSDYRPTFAGGYWHAQFSVYNPEPVDVKLTSRQIELVFDGARERRSQDYEKLPAEPCSVELKAKSATTVHVFLKAKRLPHNAIGFAAMFTGVGPNRMPVKISAHFDVPENMGSFIKPSQALKAAIDLAITSGKVAESGTIPTRGIMEAVQCKSRSSASIQSEIGPKPPHVLDAHMEPPMAIEGNTCDPWNLPEVVPEDLACLPTAETVFKKVPARFMNAKKGDIVITPGNGSLISELLATVDPPQYYSHSGIMTRNRDEITHSTAAMDRITSEPFISSDGIRPDALKYLWPGTITQSIQNTVEPEDQSDEEVKNAHLHDPETGKGYLFTDFSTIQVANPVDPAKMMTPMVIKPDPATETNEVRAKLHAIAENAIKMAGTTHYRFYCYTDPTIFKNTAPDEAKWAANTKPTVCSSMIWNSIRQTGAQIEGALENADMDGGAEISEKTTDGLYVYQADERLAAGELLWSRLNQLVVGAIGQLADYVSDFDAKVPNQVLNTFATDWSDYAAKDSQKWKDTVDASAVSPQNLLFYDAPYGYSEPLIYRGARMEAVTTYRWKEVAVFSSISGAVTFNGKPLSNAEINVSGQFTNTDKDGKFQFAKVPANEDLIVEAHKVDANVLLSGSAKVKVAPNKTANVEIEMSLPPESQRRVYFEGALHILDWEWNAAAYPRAACGVGEFVDLDPATATEKSRTFYCTVGGSVGRLTLTFSLQSDNSIKLKTKMRLYHTTDTNSDNYDEAKLDTYTLKPGEKGEYYIYIENKDQTHAWFSVHNAQNPS